MVYIVNDSWQVISSRSGNNNFLSAGIDMSLSFCFGCIETCTLQNNVYANLSPRKLCCVSHCIDLDFFSVNSDRIFSSCYFVS